MRSRVIAICAGAAVWLLSGAALAQGADDGEEHTTTYEFEGDRVEGQLEAPTGTDIRGTDRETTESLIEVRSDFVPEVLETADDL